MFNFSKKKLKKIEKHNIWLKGPFSKKNPNPWLKF